MGDENRRAFLCVLAEYDLRDFKLVDPPLIALKYNFLDDGTAVDEALRFFVAVGVLELGPRVSFQSTYRIRREFLMTVAELEAFEKASTAQQAREAMAR